MHFLLNNLKSRSNWLLALMFISCSACFGQQKKITLTFNEDGKLIDGYLPRLKAGRDCKEISIQVYIPADFLKGEEKSMQEISDSLYKAINDTASILYKVLTGCDGRNANEIVLLNQIINNSDVHKWKLKLDSAEQKFFPKELKEYADFIKLLKGRQDKNGTSIKFDDGYMQVLSNYKQFAPFRLKINDTELDTSCMKFVKVAAGKDPCRCMEKGKQYFALQFDVPSRFITSDLVIDSFQLLKVYPMKEVAIKWYNEVLKTQKKNLLKLKLLDDKIRVHAAIYSKLLTAVDNLNTLDTACDHVIYKQDSLRTKYLKDICKYRDEIDSLIGGIDCPGDCDNIILCSDALRQWVLKLMWLNGGQVKLNPFKFTTAKNLIPRKPDKKTLEKKDRIVKDATIELEFLDAAISHLRDSVMISKGISIKKNMDLLDSLIGYRDSALARIADNKIIEPKDETGDNETRRRGFLTISQLNYKGWLIPYELKTKNKYGKPDKMWVRNYYYDQAPNYIRDKFHYTYPEDENVSLLLHNLPGNIRMKVEEHTGKFADSAEFTIMAGEFALQAASLYSSLNPIAPIVKNIFKGLGTKLNKGTPEEIIQTFQETVANNLDIVRITATGQTKGKPQTWTSTNYVNKLNSQIITETLNNLKTSGIIQNDRINYPTEIKVEYSGGATLGFALAGGMQVGSVRHKFDTAINKNSELFATYPLSFSGLKGNDTKDFRYFEDRNIPVLPDTLKTFTKFLAKYPGGFILSIPSENILPKVDSNLEKRPCFDNCYINYVETLNAIATSYALIDEKLDENRDTNAVYYSGRYQLKDGKAPYNKSYKLLTYNTKDAAATETQVDSSYFDVGRFYHFQTAAGLAYTPDAGFITSVDTTNGGFTISRDEDRIRLIVGLRYYPWGLYRQRNPVCVIREKRWLHRLSVLAATSIPKPLQNLYFGGGVDLTPELNFSVGVHLQQQNRYTILNNQVKDRTVVYTGNAFCSITVNPELLVIAVRSFFMK